MHEEIIATIPQQQDTVLEVVLVHNDPEPPRIELRCLTWTVGLGWYRQKTLALDEEAARALFHTLARVRAQLRQEARPPYRGSNVIPLAKATARRARPDTPAKHYQQA